MDISAASSASAAATDDNYGVTMARKAIDNQKALGQMAVRLIDSAGTGGKKASQRLFCMFLLEKWHCTPTVRSITGPRVSTMDLYQAGLDRAEP